MTRNPVFTCFNTVNTQPLQPLFVTIMYPAVYGILLLLLPFIVSAAHAEETKIFTDADLDKYHARPMVDQETASRSEADLNSYITRKVAESLLEKEAVKREEMRRQQAEEVTRSVVHRKKVTVSQVPVSVPQKRVIVTQTPASAPRSTGKT